MKNISQIVEKDDMMKLIFDINQAMKPFKNEKEKNNWALIISPDGIIYEANSEMRGHPAIICNIIKSIDSSFKVLFEYFYDKSSWDNRCTVSFFSTMLGYVHMNGNIEDDTVEIRWNSMCISRDLKAFIRKMQGFFTTCKLYNLNDTHHSEKAVVNLSRKVGFFEMGIEYLFKQHNIEDKDIYSLMNKMGMNIDEFFKWMESKYQGKPNER